MAKAGQRVAAAPARTPRQNVLMAATARNGLRIFRGPLIDRIGDAKEAATLTSPAKLQDTVASLRGILDTVHWDAMLPIIQWAMSQPEQFKALVAAWEAVPEGDLLAPKVDAYAACLKILAEAYDSFPRPAVKVGAKAMSTEDIWHNHFAKLGDGHLIKVFQGLIQYAPTILAGLRLLGVPVPEIPGIG